VPRPSMVVISSPSCITARLKARIHAPAIHMHCTCAALPVVAALLRSGESNGLTKAIQRHCLVLEEVE
jgi:hypothetical protein